MINNVVLVGRLTKEPDLKYTGNNSAVTTFTLAVNRNFKNQSGDREADFINCVIWRKPAETLANYCRKGSLIGVIGRIQTRNYENQQGQRVYITEVVCDNFQMLESKPISSVAEPSKNEEANKNQSFSQTSMDGLSKHGFNTDTPDFSNMSDDDLPF